MSRFFRSNESSTRSGNAKVQVSLVLSALLFVLAICSETPGQADLSGADWFERELGEGVVWRHFLFEDLFGAKQSVSYVEVDLNAPEVEIQFFYIT